jgi:PleD family two-component response regulator
MSRDYRAICPTRGDGRRQSPGGISRPVHLHDRELFVRASIGIASRKTTEEGAEELLRNADVAMYMAKGASIRAPRSR